MSALVPLTRARLPLFQFEALARCEGLAHGVFTRQGGVSRPPYDSLNVSLAVGDEREQVLENRARIAAALDGALGTLRGARQVHGAAWRVVDRVPPDLATEREPADILLSGTPGALLLLKFADCTPLVLWDPVRRWVAVAHAGWRGTARNVAAATVAALRECAGSEPARLRAAIGPAIGACCYEVGPEVVEAVCASDLSAAKVARDGPRGRPHLDLAAANRLQLEAAGLQRGHIEVADRCTACDTVTFFSHRALGAPAGRFAVVAGVRA